MRDSISDYLIIAVAESEKVYYGSQQWYRVGRGSQIGSCSIDRGVKDFDTRGKGRPAG